MASSHTVYFFPIAFAAKMFTLGKTHGGVTQDKEGLNTFVGMIKKQALIATSAFLLN